MKNSKIIENLDNPFSHVCATQKSNMIIKNSSGEILKNIREGLFLKTEVNYYISIINFDYISMNFIINYYYLNVFILVKFIHILNWVNFCVNWVNENINPFIDVQIGGSNS